MKYRRVCFVFERRPRWVVPVLPKGELEVLLEAAIDLSKKGKLKILLMSIGPVCKVFSYSFESLVEV